MKRGANWTWAMVVAAMGWMPVAEAGKPTAPATQGGTTDSSAGAAAGGAAAGGAGGAAEGKPSTVWPLGGKMGPAPGTSSDRSLLKVSQDESSIEKRIADYIKATDDIVPTYRFTGQDNDNLYLEYSISPANVPKLKAIVDTSISGRAPGGGAVTERMIKVAAFYVLPASAKTPEARAKLLELNNRWHNIKWVPHRWYIDEDGDLAAESLVNIPGPDLEVSAELVRDLLLRMVDSWAEFYPQVEKTLGLPPHPKDGAK